jgi:hypothetical protein
MILRPCYSAVGPLVKDTFAVSLHLGVFWVLLGGTLSAVVYCLSADLSPEPAAVHSLELQLAGWGANGVGLLLALICTAGLLPRALSPSAASVQFARPLGRAWFLTGKILGVVAFVAFQASLFVGATWLALGLRTGVWKSAYLACIPLVLLHFTVFFSASALLAVATRSTAASLLGSVLFWLLCWSVNLGRHSACLLADDGGLTQGLARPLEASYWLLPKPLDFDLILVSSMQSEHVPGHAVDLAILAARGCWAPAQSLVASAVCAAVLLVLAGYELRHAEY